MVTEKVAVPCSGTMASSGSISTGNWPPGSANGSKICGGCSDQILKLNGSSGSGSSSSSKAFDTSSTFSCSTSLSATSFLGASTKGSFTSELRPQRATWIMCRSSAMFSSCDFGKTFQCTTTRAAELFPTLKRRMSCFSAGTVTPQLSLGGIARVFKPTCWSGRYKGFPNDCRRSGMRNASPSAWPGSSRKVRTSSSSISPGRSLKHVSEITAVLKGWSQSLAGDTRTAKPRPARKAIRPCSFISFCLAKSAPMLLRNAWRSCLSSRIHLFFLLLLFLVLFKVVFNFFTLILALPSKVSSRPAPAGCGELSKV
mmetsp:Transcript_98978/g.236182  ORF Transcript_98978/g.236182 Transcript_98978/m.236182 type:complete len:313 (+) Transcript_98978:1677-2615(+)